MMVMKRLNLENRRVLFPNFRGEKSMYNERGDITFSVLVDDLDEAEELLALGWALKPLTNEDDEVDAYHLPVKLQFKSRMPPRVFQVFLDDNRKVQLLPDTIEMLDYLPISYVDVDLNPYEWSVQGKSGIKAYCQVMYVVIEETRLDRKYADFSTPGMGVDVARE